MVSSGVQVVVSAVSIDDLDFPSPDGQECTRCHRDARWLLGYVCHIGAELLCARHAARERARWKRWDARPNALLRCEEDGRTFQPPSSSLRWREVSRG